jgi:hypothetical protein
MLIATYVVLVAIGLLLGVIECFLVPQRVFGGVEGLSALLGFVGNAAVGTFGGLGTRSPGGVFATAGGWFTAIAVFGFIPGPGGDIIIPGRLPADPGVVDVGLGLVVLGIFGAGIALLLTSRYTKRVIAPTPLT